MQAKVNEYKLTNEESSKILKEIIKMVETYPNNMELGEVIRQRYWDELKKIKNNL